MQEARQHIQKGMVVNPFMYNFQQTSFNENGLQQFHPKPSLLKKKHNFHDTFYLSGIGKW